MTDRWITVKDAPTPRTLYPTKTRLVLLDDIQRERVWREFGLLGANAGLHTDRNWYRNRKAETAVAELAQAGWVELSPQRFNLGNIRYEVSYWRLTDAGRAVLAQQAEDHQ